ncbi:hypothetical protein FACS1894139_05130 [Planctomycetales bacterium]|nr:hypothetical protein FACS1894107_03130 [Planctomycetales bacterium]GHS97084.1 hypothetical protein FACS1894108_02870 [Planctomycetales bacterium]GHT03878.1 hypothetical protein FACS1894139_05130 [Planctomycetales bacterium]
MKRRPWRQLFDDESGGVTVEWLLVTGVVALTCFAVATGVNTIIRTVFYRSALIIALPFG